MRLASLFFVSLLISSLFSCSLHHRSAPLEDVAILVDEPARMRFHGKGAGAGMMLMSSMGPMGIAVGVAIDEGIGKDIEKAALAEGFDIEQILTLAIEDFLRQGLDIQAFDTLTVKRYGFVTRPGDGDPVAAQLHLGFVHQGESSVLRYPEDFAAEDVVVDKLDRMKTDGARVLEMHSEAARIVVQHLFSGPS